MGAGGSAANAGVAAGGTAANAGANATVEAGLATNTNFILFAVCNKLLNCLEGKSMAHLQVDY